MASRSCCRVQVAVGWAELKAENQLLKNMIKDTQRNFITEGGEKAQQAWHDIIDKQIKMNAEVANTFFEVILILQPFCGHPSSLSGHSSFKVTG